jgi:hypothetical protein
VLDHGFVRVIDYMGDDAAIVQAARVSYGRGTRAANEDRADPLPHAAPPLDALRDVRDQAPREAADLRGAAVDPPPHGERERVLRALLDPRPRVLHPRAGAQLAAQSAVNRQGRGEVLEGEEAARVLDLLREDATRNYDHYLEMLNEDERAGRPDEGRQGLARELARMNLTLNAYTQWYWKTDLHNLLHFLRCAPTPTRSTRSASMPRCSKQSSELVPIYLRDYDDVQAAMKADASRIKDILIDTVAKSHPDGPFDMKTTEFESCQEFLANFLGGGASGKVFTVNYDLLLYWTLMYTRDDEDRNSLRVDDGFGNDDDDPYADYVVWHGETRANTPSVYYLHGALHLFDDRGRLQKFTWVRTGERLKEQARAEMDNGKYPLFVSEGTSLQKFDKVRHNAYLYQGLKTLAANAKQRKHCFFIHGHSLAENDNHIFNLIGRGQCQKIYVSVYGELDESSDLVKNVRRIQALRSDGRPLDVVFYDARSAKVWDRY